MKTRQEIILTAILFLSALVPALSKGHIRYPSGSEEIDSIRKEATLSKTTRENYMERLQILYSWIHVLQQRGADTSPYFHIDRAYYRNENFFNNAPDEKRAYADSIMFDIIDRGFSCVDSIQTRLSEKGAMFTPFTGSAEGFPEGGDMDADWPMFQANEHNDGNTAAPGPVYGKEKWRNPVGLGWYSRPVIDGDKVYLASPGLRITGYCLDLHTGKEIWRSTQRHPLFGIYKYPAIASTPVISGNHIILREMNSHGGNEGQARNLIYLDKNTGKTLSRKYAGHIDYRTMYAPVSGNGKYVVYPFGKSDIYSTPSICQNFNRLICADAENERKLWDFNVGDIDALAESAIDNRFVYQGTTDGYLYALRLPSEKGNLTAWKFQTGYPVNTKVEIADGRLYFGDNGGTVYCLESETGKLIWKNKLEASDCMSRKQFSVPACINGRIYVGSTGKHLYCLNADSGRLLWKTEVSDWVRSRPEAIGKYVYAATVGGVLYQFTDKGKVKKKQQASTHAIYSDLVKSESGELLFSDSNLWAYCLDGTSASLLWKKSLLESFENEDGERIFSDILSGGTFYQSKPTASEGILYYGTPSGFIYAVDSGIGKEIWKFETGGGISVGPAIQDGKVYIGQQGGERFFYALDARTGNPVWKQTIPGGWVWGSATVSDGKVYIPTVSGYAMCLDGETGHIIWMYPTAKSIPAEPAVDGDLVYFGSWSNSLYAFNKHNGEIVWKHNGVGLDSGTLIALDGKIYLPHHDNIFMYFDSKTGEILNGGNMDKSGKGQYSNFNASPAFADGKAFFSARVGEGLRGVPLASKVYCVNAETAEIYWTFPDGGGLSAPALANGRVYIASGNTPFFYCLDQETGNPHWIFKFGQRVEESTLCIYRNMVYALSADGYIHAIE